MIVNHGMGVIIVDDDRIFIDSMVDLMSVFGFEVLATATNGKQAVELYRKLRPDVILLDIVMERYDGFYAIKEIQKLDKNATFVVMSALDSKNVYDDLVGLGIRHILRKPVDPDTLKEVLSNL